jgi:VWFA-related protein
LNKRIFLLAVLAAGMAAGPLARAGLSRQSLPQLRPLRHDAAAIVKLIVVRVLGPDGRPVAGLRKEDFKLYEDGLQRTITEFEVHRMTEAGMATAAAVPLPEEAARRAAEAAGRKLFFFLDQQASDRAGKDKAKTVALDFLDAMARPGDQIAVIGWYAMSGFYIREYLTSDLGRIRRAIKGVTEIPPSAGEPVGLLPDDAEVAHAPSGPGLNMSFGPPLKGVEISAAPPEVGGGLMVVAPGTGAFQRADFITRLAEIAGIFKMIPGNKSLVLFTARNMGPEAERIGKLFGAAGTAVYAINTQDWKAGPFGTKSKFIWTEHSLKDLSAASGGEYFADINDATAIARDVQDLTGNYYVVGYYVQYSWEGTYHKIRIEVARPEARVLVQDGYSDSKPFDRMSDFEKDLHLLDLLWSDQPLSGPALLPIDPLVVRFEGGIQGCFLTRWEAGAKTGPPAAPVEIFALVRDGRGQALVSKRWDVDLTSREGRTVWAYLIYPLAAGVHEVRLVVRDRRTGESCVGRCSFDVAPALEEEFVLGSPLLFEAGPAASFLRLSTGPPKVPRGKSVAGEPSLQSLYRLIPKEGTPVVGEISSGARRVVAVIPIEFNKPPSEDAPILSVTAKFVSSPDGREVPLEVEIRDHVAYEGSPDILALDLVLEDVPPGQYDLVITVEDMGTDRQAACRKTLTLR